MHNSIIEKVYLCQLNRIHMNLTKQRPKSLLSSSQASPISHSVLLSNNFALQCSFSSNNSYQQRFFVFILCCDALAPPDITMRKSNIIIKWFNEKDIFFPDCTQRIRSGSSTVCSLCLTLSTK